MALQRPLEWTDTAANLSMFTEAISRHIGEDIDVIVLPEMFNTGLIMQPQGIVDDGTEVLTWMRQMAQRMNAAITGSTAVQTEDTTFRNRLYFVQPDGSYTTYDKRHLFYYGGEGEAFRRGQERVIVKFRGWRFLLQVCYDLRYPCWARCHDDYDAIIYSANWPINRQLAWDTLIRARAIENQCYLIGANRCGDDPRCTYKGMSAVIDFFGETVCQAEPYREADLVVELDMSRLQRYREKFPLMEDQDRYELIV